ncbi:MAG: hypothetical protein KDC38_18380 [Planctomycetes bacterium]|nr:hypothetical protein [Planctomycetota bacterium]
MSCRCIGNLFTLISVALLSLSLPRESSAQTFGDGPRLGPLSDRMTQVEIEGGAMTLAEMRAAGLKIFTSPFNQHDGMGDGPMNPTDPTSPGGRPTLQNNGRLLRVNGLDAQTCLECHAVVSTATQPPSLGIGGSGTTATSAMFMAKNIDVDDSGSNGFAFYDGRFIVPPALFGTGGVQLLAKEMTAELQALKQQVIANPGTGVALVTKGVHFGKIRSDSAGRVNYDHIEGIDEDLVVRPFGRKGEFPTVRQFDQGAMQFHFGMEPVEIVGPGVDNDGDGVSDELLIGEMSALEIFVTTQDRPIQDPRSPVAELGAALFEDVGCVMCHRPELHTDRAKLPYSFPQIDTDPFANVFLEIDLSSAPMSFERSLVTGSGVQVPLFSDLKRHDMGPGLQETFQGATLERNSEFITAKLWGVADTAPYLHDGRAQTLREAIELHGGEAQPIRDEFLALLPDEQIAIIAFLRTLRTPVRPNQDVAPLVGARPSNPLD